MKKILTIIIFTILMTISLDVSCFAGWLVFHKPEYRGRIIDAETKEPIKGAVVVAMYQTHPILSHPAGGSASIIYIKEALTDEKGEFHIPSYTTGMGPNTKDESTQFIIYKPGYGSYPGRRISPLYMINPDLFFSGELGSSGEIERHSKVISFTFGIVELPKLHTREERLRAIPAPPTIEIKDTPFLYKAINEEGKSYGLKPIGR